MRNLLLLVLVFLSLQLEFSLVHSLKCKHCNSGQGDSECRKGTETKLTECTIKGEDHCYVDYILNEGSEPLYRRGCSPGDWCRTQMGNHAEALKFCNTCQGSECNNDVIGSNSSSSKLCRSCRSESIDSECRRGTVTETEECGSGQLCVMSYFVEPSISRRDTYNRGCGDKMFCNREEEKHGYHLQKCDTCKYDLCNNEPLPIYYSSSPFL